MAPKIKTIFIESIRSFIVVVYPQKNYKPLLFPNSEKVGVFDQKDGYG